MATQPYLGNNIFCIEGDWEEDLRKKTSILSGLEMLSSISQMDFVYRTCASESELIYRLQDYIKKSKAKSSIYHKYDVLYLATHGLKGNLMFDKEVNILQFFQQNNHFKRHSFGNKIIHFGSCSTLKMKEEELDELKKYTGAKIISGFNKNINFLESTLFEVLYFNLCNEYERAGNLRNHLFKKYSGFCDDLGFVMV